MELIIKFLMPPKNSLKKLISKIFFIKIYFLLNKAPNIKFKTERPTFLSIPFTEVGMPVSRANFCFAVVMPRALFQLKLTPDFPIRVYLYQGTK
jgi:hypothetical protein